MTVDLKTIWDETPDLADADGRAEAHWPQLGSGAFHGVVGEFARAAGPFTEADPAAVLVTTLVAAGCAVNRGPHALAGNDHHSASLFAVIVGATSKGGKGTSLAVAREALAVADEGLIASRVIGGFGSGEAVVDAVRDPSQGDEGATDSRLLIVEAEFARMLKVASREGSTLSVTVREGWDGRPLQARSRARTAVASHHHLSVVGHVTVEELRARLTDVETYAGFANRFLWVCCRRSKRLAAGGNVPPEITNDFGRRIGDAIHTARNRGRLSRTPAAEVRWAELYDVMADDEPGGLLGAVVGRDAAQCLRLSLLYALLDGANVIDVQHVEAAWSLWSYCRASAAYIFGDATGDKVSDRLLAAVREAGEKGLDGTGQRKVLGGHVSGDRLASARESLERRGLVVTTTEDTGGRRRTVTVAVAQ